MPSNKSLPAIEALWREHLASPFPEGAAGAEVAGICITSLDTFAAGCIDAFVSRGGRLDIWRTAILGLCYGQLSVAIPELTGESRTYFARLKKLIEMVLEAVRDSAASDSSGS